MRKPIAERKGLFKGGKAVVDGTGKLSSMLYGAQKLYEKTGDRWWLKRKEWCEEQLRIARLSISKPDLILANGPVGNIDSESASVDDDRKTMWG